MSFMKQRIEAEVVTDIPENHLYFEEIGKVQQADCLWGLMETSNQKLT